MEDNIGNPKKTCATPDCKKQVRKNEFCVECTREKNRMRNCKGENCDRKSKSEYCYTCAQKIKKPQPSTLTKEAFLEEVKNIIQNKNITEKKYLTMLDVIREMS